MILRGKESDNAKVELTTHMRAQLRNKPQLLNHILPEFPPGCRRLTPVSAVCIDMAVH